ncbi:MAG TPA: hypothetical protein PK604_13675 [Acetivibrio clariflavus]|nr:hypothetical protein [Acetivibrio clariflavus]HPU42151.1 hypothetical protein [Acetivibrio clariflavus]
MDNKKMGESPQLLHVGITYNLKKSNRYSKWELNSESLEPVDNEAEYDDITTVMAIKKALEGKNCRVTLLEADRELPVK